MSNNLLKVKASKLFYQSGQSKIEIGKKLRISRFKVAKLLEEAVKDGIVNISIDEPQNTFLDLENSLEERFKIYRAVVVETSFNYEETKKKYRESCSKLSIRYVIREGYSRYCMGVYYL